MKTLAKILAPILVLILGGLGARQLISMRPEPEKVVIEPVLPLVSVTEALASTHTYHVMAHGTVQARTASELVAEVEGRVIQVSPSLVNGGFFEAGDLLLEIDREDYQLARAQAEQSLAAAERRLFEEQADAALAREEWDALGEGDGTPLALHLPQVAEARATLAAARAGLERAERDLARTQVRAPFVGRVSAKSVDLGQFVSRGKTLAHIYAVDYAEVRLPLPDAELAFLDLPLIYRGEGAAVDQPQVVLSTEFGGQRHSWRAQIVRTEGEIDPATRMVIAVARVDDPYGRGDDLDRPPLAVGMFVQAHVTGRRVDDVFVLPREALRGTGRVFIMDDEDRLRMRQVQVLRADRDGLVIGQGLQDGDRVIVSPLETVTDGTLLRLPASQPEANGTR
ncbi:MAG: RND family efflux transporter MFP subunit [Chlamydiales bacterium]|jgi:RND family efflux transporter MFP subunit